MVTAVHMSSPAVDIYPPPRRTVEIVDISPSVIDRENVVTSVLPVSCPQINRYLLSITKKDFL